MGLEVSLLSLEFGASPPVPSCHFLSRSSAQILALLLDRFQEGRSDDLDDLFELIRRGPEPYLHQRNDQRTRMLCKLTSNCLVKQENMLSVYRKPFSCIAEELKTGDWWSRGERLENLRSELLLGVKCSPIGLSAPSTLSPHPLGFETRGERLENSPEQPTRHSRLGATTLPACGNLVGTGLRGASHRLRKTNRSPAANGSLLAHRRRAA